MRLDDDLVGRVDGACGSGGRSVFIRDALEAALGGSIEPCFDSSVGDFSLIPDRWRDDAMALCAALGSVQRRQVADRMGWLSPRADRVLDLMLGAGLITEVDGIIHRA